MSKKIKLQSYSDGELLVSQEYEGFAEKKGRYLRYEYLDEKGAKTHMVVCYDDGGLYRLDSEGERKLSMRCSDGKGKAVLTLGAHLLEGVIGGFGSVIYEDEAVYRTQIVYILSFGAGQESKTRLIIEAKK